MDNLSRNRNQLAATSGVLKTTQFLALATAIGLLSTTGVHAAAPNNDHFTNRFVLFNTNFNIKVSGNNQNATKEVGEPNHAGNTGGRSVWWTWKAPVTTTVTVDTLGSPFDTLLAIYTGASVSNLTTMASDDDSGSNKTSRLTFPALAGTNYEIAVDGWSGASSNFFLHFMSPPRPPRL